MWYNKHGSCLQVNILLKDLFVKEGAVLTMIPRFYRFILLVDGTHKNISKLKFDTAPYLGIKSVHMFWIYELYTHPEGLIAAEIAANNMISRSLISREIDRLCRDGYVEIQETAHGKRKNYNSRILLTEKGRQVAERIMEEAIKVQTQVSANISEEELTAFYQTFEKLNQNLKNVAKERENANLGQKK